VSKLRERIGRTLLMAYAATGIGQVATQAYFLLILKFLPIGAVGIYTWAIAVATIYSYVLDLGLGTFLVGELSESRFGLRQVMRLIVMTRAPLVALGVILLGVWGRLESPPRVEFWTLATVAAAYVIQLVDVGLVPWFQVHQRQSKANVFGSMLPIARLGALAVCLVLGLKIDLRLVLWVTITTQVANTLGIIGLAFHEQHRLRGRLPDHAPGGFGELWSKFWHRGPRLALMYVFVALQARLDWVLVSGLLSKEALANYSLANKIVEALMLFAAVWARTSFPWISRDDADEAEMKVRLATVRRVFVVCSAAVTAVVVFGAIPLARCFFGSKFSGAEASIRVMAPAGAVFMLNQYFFYVLLARRLEGRYTLVVLVTTVLQVATDVWLLPRIGIAGAAVGMLVLGVTMHAGQMILLCTNAAMTLAETLMQEVFILASVATMLVLARFAVPPVAGAALALGAVGVLGWWIVLSPQDKQRIWNWTAEAAARTAGRGNGGAAA
jgi:O-antigen/teichoic acid export membrane protein